MISIECNQTYKYVQWPMNANKIPLDIPLSTKGSNGTQSKCVMLVIGWAWHIFVLRQTARQWTESTAHDPHSHTHCRVCLWVSCGEKVCMFEWMNAFSVSGVDLWVFVSMKYAEMFLKFNLIFYILICVYHCSCPKLYFSPDSYSSCAPT